MPKNERYGGDLTRALLLLESRKVAKLLLQGLSPAEVRAKSKTDNLMQARSPVTGDRITRVILSRLTTMDAPLWKCIHDGAQELATQATFAALLQYDKLLGDFIQSVIHEYRRTFKPTLSLNDWNCFFEEAQKVQPSLAQWSETQVKKVRKHAFLILAEAGVIDSTKTKAITPFFLLPEVRDYLKEHDKAYVLQCLEGLQ